jgi:glycosyltransferase involved in cell wall biosynthesis
MISVIIPNYNHALYLKKRIESVLNQTYQNFELIILDDCSTDHSRKITEEYCNHEKVKLIIYNKKNSGSPFQQWKKGIELSNGEYIWIAESDDWAEKKFLDRLMAIIKTDQTIGVAYCQSYDVNESGEILASRINWTNDFPENIWKKDFIMEGKEFLKFLYRKNVIPNVSACLLKKECLIEALSKIPRLSMAGDWFTWLLILNQPAVSIAFVSDHLNYFRITEQSTRNHTSREKQAKRLLEEARIFNSGKFEIDRTSLQDKNKSLKDKWLHLHVSQKISYPFFRICKVTDISRALLLIDYLKYRKIVKKK